MRLQFVDLLPQVPFAAALLARLAVSRARAFVSSGGDEDRLRLSRAVRLAGWVEVVEVREGRGTMASSS